MGELTITTDLATKLSEKGVLVDAEGDGWIRFIGMANKRKVTIDVNPARYGDEYFNQLIAEVEARFMAGGDEE